MAEYHCVICPFCSSIAHVLLLSNTLWSFAKTAVIVTKTERQATMETRRREQSSSYSPIRLQNQLLSGLIAFGVLAAVGAPARAQYQYAQQPAMMAVGAASGLFRTVPRMATGLVRTLVPHHGHKNKDKNNKNAINGNAMSASSNTTQGQVYSGANGQPTGNMMPPQASVAPMAQSGYSNIKAQNYPIQNEQTRYNNPPGLNLQNGQNAYSTVQGQMFNAPGQAAYGMQGATPPYGPSAGQ
jgi:hypothetical protein